MKTQRHNIVVRGRGEFPHDMLRYDDLAFAAPIDATLAEDANQWRSINLVSDYDRPRVWTPKVARWESFGWKVTFHNGEAAQLATATVPTRPSPDSPEYHEAYDAMLAALRECLDAEERRLAELKSGAPASTYTAERLARVRAAIAKAEGRS
jgi:hypothetical protein